VKIFSEPEGSGSIHSQYEYNVDLTLPGHKYLGPGTHVTDNVISGMLPTNADDALALIHDLQYLNGDSQRKADAIMMNNSSNNISGLLSKIGLGVKTVFNYNKPSSTDRRQAEALLGMVNSNPKFTKRYKELGVDLPGSMHESLINPITFGLLGNH